MLRQILTIIIVFLTMITSAQTKGYSTLDYTFEYHLNDFNNHNLKGIVKSLTVYKKGNNNFHSKNLSIKLDTLMLDCHKYLIENYKISEIQFLNSDGTKRFKRLFFNGQIQELVSYKSNEIIQDIYNFVYNDFGQLIAKVIKDGSDNIRFNVKYNYDEKRRLESVIGDESYNYKYIYDETGGFYDVKYSEYNGQINIHETRYNRYLNTENLNVILQNEPKIKFEEIKNLKKVWQSLSRFDNSNKIIFEQSKDLKLNQVQIESSYKYDKNNQIISKTFKTNNGTNDTYSFLYKDKTLIRQFAKNAVGFENFNQILEYNEYGDLKKKHNTGIGINDEIYTFDYTYDNSNNWTEKKEIVNGKLFEITYRKIEYKK